MSDLGIAVTLYLVSLVPWGLSFFFEDREAQWGLAILDTLLTWGSYLYAFRAFGWWAIFFIAANLALGCLLNNTDFVGYDNLTDASAKKHLRRRLSHYL